jgi:hypothetical protein
MERGGAFEVCKGDGRCNAFASNRLLQLTPLPFPWSYMKAFALLLTTALLLLLSCTPDEPAPEPAILPSVGIRGMIRYGQGDCMPAIDFSKRVYRPYNGEVYFYRKAALDQLGNRDVAQLKASSPHYPVREGQLAAVPPADTYVLMLDSLYSTEYVVTITAGQFVSQDFTFWKCTSY